MSLWICQECGAPYSVGAPRCPHCMSTDYREADVAKISVTDGPTDKTVQSESEGSGKDADSCPGNSSKPSETSSDQSSQSSPQPGRQPARSAGRRSKADRPEVEPNSTAPSKDGSTPGTGSDPANNRTATVGITIKKPEISNG